MSDSNIHIGCQIDLDSGQANPSGRIIDDIRNACTELIVSFESSIRCYFNDDSSCYFRYKGIDWVPASCKEYVTQNETYSYDITAYPKFFFDMIEKASKDTRAFVSSVGAKCTQEFENIEIICPLQNRRVVQLINEYRTQFFQEAFKQKDMSSSVLLYMCMDEILSITFGKWMNKDALPLDASIFQANTTPVYFYNEQAYNDLICDRIASHWKGSDYLQRMFGRVFEAKGSTEYIFLGRYTLKLEGSNEYDSDKTYMCIRNEEEIGNMSGFASILAEIKYVYK